MRRGAEARRTVDLFVLILTTSVVAMSLADHAFAQSSSATAVSQKIVFTYADLDEPSSLNPLVGASGIDYTMWALAYDLPINFATKDFGPDFDHSLVTSVDAGSDGMTFTYHFRSGVKWSDGTPFSASDAAWTFNFYKQNNVPNYSSDLALMDTATAPDDTTMVLTSTKPTSFYSGSTVFLYEYILPEHVWGKYEHDYRGARRETGFPSVGTGPFVITDYQRNQYIQLDRNPYYWGLDAGLTPHVDRIIYRIFGNQDAEAAALQAGDIDLGYFSSASIVRTLASRGLETRGALIPSFGEISVNTGSAYETNPAGGFTPHGDGHPALADVVVRQAIRRAIDDQTLVDKVLLGYGTPGISPVLPDATTGAWEPGSDDPDLSFNIPAANQMLDDAGYTMGPDGVRIDPKSGRPLVFRFFSRASDQHSIDIVPYITDWLSQIGIKLDEPRAVTTSKLYSLIQSGDYDLFEWGWNPIPDPSYSLDLFACAQRPPDARTYRLSDTYYCNPEYDRLNELQGTVTDPTERADVVHQMQAILYRDQPNIVLWNDATLEAYSKDWTGFKPQPYPDGDVLATYGPLSFISLRPVHGTSAGVASAGGSSTDVWLWVFVLVVVITGRTHARSQTSRV